MRLTLLLALLVLLPTVTRAAVLTVGPGKPFAKPSAALAAAKEGDTLEIFPGDYTGDVATIRTAKLTIRGVGKERIKLPAGGKHAGGKAIWIAAGRDLVVENLEFSGARVPDRNGAGIRAEGAGLTVRNCRFYDCENGILGGNGEILIEHSEFAHCGPVADPATHSLYIGERCTKLTFRYNYSTDVIQGHLLKSRAAENWILYNRLSDEDGTGSACIDLPNGGYAVIVGNLLHKGAKAQNTRVIAWGFEGVKHQRNGLLVAFNTMVYDNHRKNAFFVDVQKAPADFKPVIYNNLCTGPIPLTNHAAPDAGGNLLLKSSADAKFVNAARFDFRLLPTSPAGGKAAPLPRVGDVDLAPTMQYVHPAGNLERGNARDVGAFGVMW